MLGDEDRAWFAPLPRPRSWPAPPAPCATVRTRSTPRRTRSGTTSRWRSSRRAAPQAPPPRSSPEEDKFAKLAKLAELQKQGILTDEEFAAEKAKILAT